MNRIEDEDGGKQHEDNEDQNSNSDDHFWK